MLKLKRTLHLSLPSLSILSEPVRFSPVRIDNDELSQAIASDVENRDDAWELTERPDMGELTQFWSDVETDVANDPEWFTFNNEES